MMVGSLDENYLMQVQTPYPELRLETARLLDHDGQFNDIMIVNEALIFRFPRSRAAVGYLRHEARLLDAIGPLLPLPTPRFTYRQLEGDGPDGLFAGYPMIPGETLRPERLAAIAGEGTVARLAEQLATFLQALHAVEWQSLALELPEHDGRAEWRQTYDEFRDWLYPCMRPAVRAEVSAAFDRFLGDAANFDYRPALCHGDFGGSNILFDPENGAISGIIDFGFCGPGDPAIDLASLSTLGEAFSGRLFATYPQLEGMVSRARFYRSTFGLLQALYALRDGDREGFEDGLSAYV
jgi:aminoglycoside 2''-phosphotransferase